MDTGDLTRILRLQGSDEGFYCLAIQSLIEKHLNTCLPELQHSSDFPEKLQLYAETRSPLTHQQQRLLSQLRRDRGITNRVRHEFHQLTLEEAAAMTHNLLRFGEFAAIPDSDTWQQLRRGVEQTWLDCRSPLEQQHELRHLRELLQQLQTEQQDFQAQLARLEEVELREQHLQLQLAVIGKQLQESSGTAAERKQRIADLRRERHNLQQELRRSRVEAAELAPVREQLAYLERLSSYSRTRRDYEQSVIRLTPEQADVLARIKLNHDFLVRGNAGTGKTLVLLKALHKAAELLAQERGLGLTATHHPERIVLLTYTTTLVRYNKYLAEIMQQHEITSNIQTADSLFLEKLHLIDPDSSVDYRIARELCEQHNTTGFLNTTELYTEIEDFIFAGAVQYEEYIDQRIPRSGLKHPLNIEQRQQVWQIRDRIAAEMRKRKCYSKGFSRIVLLEHLQGNTPPPGMQDISYVFIDETQDLTAIELMLLKLIASRPLIMAGDVGQSIYGFRSPYARAGIRLQGRTRTLKLNFRSTAAIHEFAESYRHQELAAAAETSGNSAAPDRHHQHHEDDPQEIHPPEAFREGPVPELLCSSDKACLLEGIIDKAVFFVRRLGYDPENICLLAPRNADLEKLAAGLERHELPSMNIRDPQFNFTDEGVVRLSTLHSSKGLDFPVVLLYLPQLYHLSHLDAATIETMERNLLYVACTRAMDHLVIALNPDSSSAAIRGLAAVQAGRQENQRS
ncbi:3'-5' exonuclease [Spirochaeta africana]|uniref:DNA 3'-5' helicase n=1 Tax=Spirochaeta africana (strain ATCC 700263 / DSM 8902 / Z-7692) TaxID=889378 RepID=H9ULH5_SPIAZ|nr:3'-5' exonuclease [Spirochaeta africana]AFG38368.1 DNA/RNA helicase, superfamily I [Spirochaeta africana DSM 8902]